jgi:hypothetical protein
LMYSIFSLLASLAILATFAWVDFFFIGFIENLTSESWELVSEGIIYAMMFAYYFIFSFITLFFNTAIITSVQRRNEWKDNKIWDGLKDAMGHLKEILIWSAISAVVTTLLKILQSQFWEDSIVWRIIIGLVWWMWNILTFFSFPLMIIKKMWPKDAIKESGALFKKTWWERAMIHVWIGFLFFFLYLLLIILSIGIMYTGLIWIGIIILLWGMLFLLILGSTCDTIIKTILLHYATTWELPSGLENEKSIIELAWEKVVKNQSMAN